MARTPHCTHIKLKPTSPPFTPNHTLCTGLQPFGLGTFNPAPNSTAKDASPTLHPLLATQAHPAQSNYPAIMLTQLGQGRKAKKVLVIVTGGTLIMKPSGTGDTLDVCPGFLSELLALPEWRHENLPDIDVLEWDVLTDSAMMGPNHWIKIAEDIESAYFRYDGFVIVHGTDTMAYSASALAFMLEDLGKPVVFTGSQIPLAEVYSDARNNLVSSLLFVCRQDFQEVCIVFGSRLLRGCRTTKVHSFDLQAFASPNFPPLATLGVNLEFAVHLSLSPPRKAMRVHKDMDANLVVVRLVPGFEDDALFAMVNHSRHLHGIILLLYGTGNGDTSTRSGLLEAVTLAAQKGIIVVVLTQCYQGGVLLDKYSVGVALRAAGVVSGHDMTVEACATKISYLYSRTGGDIEKVKSLLSVDLRGELSNDSRYRSAIQDVAPLAELRELGERSAKL